MKEELVLVCYVDDHIFLKSFLTLLNNFKLGLGKEIKVRDPDRTEQFFGMK